MKSNDGDNGNNLATIINRLEKNGSSWEERAEAAVNFLENKNKSAPQTASCGDDVDDEPLTEETDPATCGGDAVGSGGDAVETGAHAAQSDHDATTSGGQAAENTSPPAEQSGLQHFHRNSDFFEPGLDLHNYLDKRSPLDQLSQNQREAIAKLLDDYKPETVQKLIEKPAPKGLGLVFSASALSRFKRRHRKVRAIMQQRELTAQAEALLQTPAASSTAFIKASERLLKMRLLKSTSDPSQDLDKIEALTRILNALRKQALAERKQRHAEQAKTPPQPSPPEPIFKGNP